MHTEARKRSFVESLGDDHETLAYTTHDGFTSHVEKKSSHSLSTIKSETEVSKWRVVNRHTKKKKKYKQRPEKTSDRTQNHAPPGLNISPNENDHPAVTCAAPHTLNSSLRLADLQSLILYCLADGVSPQWVSVRCRNQIRKVVVLMVPGLERGMFTGEVDLAVASHNESIAVSNKGGSSADSSKLQSFNAVRMDSKKSPDDFLPVKLDKLPLPKCLGSLSKIFPQLFPMKTPGEDRRLHSPVAAILSVPLSRSSRSAEEKKASKTVRGPKPVHVAKEYVDEPTSITNFVTSPEDLAEHKFVLHPSSYHNANDEKIDEIRRRGLKVSAVSGWKDVKFTAAEVNAIRSQNSDTLDGGCHVYAIDCEMCKVKGDDGNDEFALTRISVINWNGGIVLDELVKPEKPIIDYVTAFSGITAEKLEPVTTTLSDIQDRLLNMLGPTSILIGHSLNSDLNAIKMTHPCIVDTSIIYPHPRGLPFKSSLKWLSQKYLNREIQKHDDAVGHDSIEDARAALDLVKAKCAHGPHWGTSEATSEDIFRHLSRAPRPGPAYGNLSGTELRDHCTGAVVDHGQPEKTLGKNALLSFACSNDEEVVAGIKRAANGDEDGSIVPRGGVDFVFARMRELEALRRWSTDANPNLTSSTDDQQPAGSALTNCLDQLQSRILKINADLPSCTLFIVYSGIGDPREMKRLSDMHRQFRREYSSKKWDEVSVKWTDNEEQALKKAVKKARSGIAFLTVT